jgi:hypothetical protein
MVEISEIMDADSLREWLKALPFDEDEKRRIAVTIAYRAAMRVLPVYWNWRLVNWDENGPDRPALAIARACLIVGVSGERPSPEISAAVELPSRVSDPDAAVKPAVEAAVRSIRAAAGMIYGENTITGVGNVARDAAETVGADLSVVGDLMSLSDLSAGAKPEMWKAIRSDCATLAQGGVRLDAIALWPDKNPYEGVWRQIRDALPEGWEFWRDWYQDALDGKPPNWDMLTEIALIPNEDWDKGADHVNRLIAGIVEKHRLLHEVRRLRGALVEIRQKARRGPSDGANMLGHNNPPEMIADDPQVIEKVEIIWANLNEAEKTLEKLSPSPDVLKRIGQSLLNVGNYVLGLADVIAKAAAKSVGKAAGPSLLAWLLANAPAVKSLGKGLIEYAKSYCW